MCDASKFPIIYQERNQNTVSTSRKREKKRAYVKRVTQVEKGSFIPFVMSTSGGMGKGAELFVKIIAELISVKRNEEYLYIVNYIRTLLSFCLLKSMLLGARGERGKKDVTRNTPLSNL